MDILADTITIDETSFVKTKRQSRANKYGIILVQEPDTNKDEIVDIAWGMFESNPVATLDCRSRPGDDERMIKVTRVKEGFRLSGNYMREYVFPGDTRRYFIIKEKEVVKDYLSKAIEYGYSLRRGAKPIAPAYISYNPELKKQHTLK